MRLQRASLNRVFNALLFISFGVFVGCLFDKIPARADKAPYLELEKFSKVLQFIESDYVEEKKASALIQGAIKGMLQTLDPHSAYLSPEIFKEMKVETSGKFGGLGIEVSIKGGMITVVSPIDDTPAYRAGIKTGDRIIRIDDKPTKSLSLPEAVSMMRGKTGSPIKITILRVGVEKPLEYTLKRESIKIQSVRSTKLEHNIGYIRVSSFMERTAEDLAKAIDKMGGPKLEGIVLDLRGNPGGLLDQAVKVGNLFIDEGPIVYTIGRDRSKKEIEHAQKGRRKTEAPMVVLVDGSSASASEIVAGALQDYGRAVIAGQRTFGKGSVQTIIPMGDEDGLKLTVARYYTPSGRSIQARGIDPDVEIAEIDPKAFAEAQANADRIHEADLEGHFANEGDDEEGGDALEVKPIKIGDKEKPKDAKDKEKEEADEAFLPLEEKVKKDYMIVQAQGILRTMAVIRQGSKKPEFRLDDGKKEDAAKK